MALRWRKSGEIVCAAKSRAHKDDTYINDRLHYELAVIQKTIVPDKDETKTGIWYWLHGECCISEHPDDARSGTFVRAEL